MLEGNGKNRRFAEKSAYGCVNLFHSCWLFGERIYSWNLCVLSIWIGIVHTIQLSFGWFYSSWSSYFDFREKYCFFRFGIKNISSIITIRRMIFFICPESKWQIQKLCPQNDLLGFMLFHIFSCGKNMFSSKHFGSSLSLMLIRWWRSFQLNNNLTCKGVIVSSSLVIGQICFNAMIASLQNFNPITSSSSRPYL